MTEYSFRWLHLSDLHLGMKGQAPYWSQVRHHLFDDLALLHDQSGPWDVIIFSGDIVQKGTADEFSSATEALLELFHKIKEFGSTPIFTAVPGNHDLVRPNEKDMAAKLLKSWQFDPSVRDEFLSNPESPYRQTVISSLANYATWFEQLPKAGIPILSGVDGLLPGDRASKVEFGDYQVGIVSLNSTWLQLHSNNKAGDLHVDLSQLAGMLPDPEGWCRSNDFNIIITHHPMDWLSTSSQEIWRQEIAPPGRFDAHLFGHMHEPSTGSSSIMGAAPVVTIQSPSLFGLEYLSDGKTKRINGYSSGALISNDGGRRLKHWPRIYQVGRSGQGKMVPDNEFYLQDNLSAITQLPDRPRKPSSSKVPSQIDSSINRDNTFAAIRSAKGVQLISRFKYHLPSAGVHTHVRKVEQAIATAALDRRALWVVADWGLSSDSFVASVLETSGNVDIPVFRLDLSEIPVGGKDLDLEIEAKLGVRVQELSEELAALHAVLLIDDITLGERPLGMKPRERELEQLSQAMLDYCTSLTIIIRTRSEPANDSFGKVEIAALDEADLKAYIGNHADGGENLYDPISTSQLLALTGGVPDQVDKALTALKVVTLSVLLASSDEGLGGYAGAGSQPVIRVIDELQKTDNASLKRAFEMLKALATFPHGAQFEHIRRFNGGKGFYPDNATELLQRGLINAHTLPGIEQSIEVEKKRILSVPRNIRDIVRAQMSASDLERHDRRASELYFGLDWRNGSKNWPSERKYSSPKCSHHEIANASEILMRLLKAATQNDDEEELTTVIRLAASFSDALDSGSHYYGMVSFGSTFLPAVPAGFETPVILRVKADYGTALRMIGERSSAIEILESIDTSLLDRSDKESLQLNLVLAYESVGDERAKNVAEELLKATKSHSRKLQLRGVIIGLMPESPIRKAKLVALEREARKKEYNVVANNIALSLARESDDVDEGKRLLNRVINPTAGEQNVYNEARAIVELAELSFENSDQLSPSDHINLIKAYQYVFTQRIPSLFDRCHDALWKSFKEQEQVPNLFALFRHSSFIWRIRGDVTSEHGYIVSLSEMARKKTYVVDSRDAGYFKARLVANSKNQELLTTTGAV
jgi:predicted phosphodiesterase